MSCCTSSEIPEVASPSTEITATLTTADTEEGLPVFGYPGHVFYAIHYTAITSLCISALVSIGVIIHFFLGSQVKNVWCRPIGERLVFYLAVADLCHHIIHLLDHGYMLAAVDHPPDTACSVFSTMLHFCALFQMGVVLFTAVNLCCLVVKERKLKLGKRDWRLLVCVLGVPAVLVSCGLAFEVWGPKWSLVSGFIWNCYFFILLDTGRKNLRGKCKKKKQQMKTLSVNKDDTNTKRQISIYSCVCVVSNAVMTAGMCAPRGVVMAYEWAGPMISWQLCVRSRTIGASRRISDHKPPSFFTLYITSFKRTCEIDHVS